MKLFLFALAAAPWALAAWAGFGKREAQWVVLLTGDTDGYLAPCGCTKPMSGGIRRRASAVRALTAGSNFALLDNGSLSQGQNRQDHLKSETLAEALATMGVTAVHLTAADARLGPGLVIAVNQLAGNKLITGSLEPSASNTTLPFLAKGPFLIGAVSPQPESLALSLGERPVAADEAIQRLVSTAQERGLKPILMLQGTREQAARLARRFPVLRLIQYRSASSPREELDTVAGVVLASPGDKAKHLVRLLWTGSRFQGYAAVDLGPQFKDDPAASAVFKTYLGRVDDENLLDKLRRTPGDEFVGSEACGKCHAEALRIWKASQHGSALKTLEDEGHGRDPDCVYCHVVGLDKTSGFRSRTDTPRLADVGCESCHGPGARHSVDPYRDKLGKAGARSCAPCHVPEHSPGFDFHTYWPRIEHK